VEQGDFVVRTIQLAGELHSHQRAIGAPGAAVDKGGMGEGNDLKHGGSDFLGPVVRKIGGFH